ncbi:AraC family transcriptional regulator [Cohnella xylanilytica]|uniref:AraC family transcriptional regulator n=1 Tax=Cohnella xylanilytica TaxID=557555 RepID=A0A841U873_9BACL|nr:AraC family transcriptional regulator [Cohnella xylanilytica]
MEALAVSHSQIPEWEESRFPLYAADRIQSLYGSSNRPMHAIDEELTVLIAIAGGEGMLKVGDKSYELTEGSAVLLPPRSRAALIASRPRRLHAYKLAIAAMDPPRGASSAALTRSSEAVSGSSVLFFPREPAIVACLEELYIHRSPENEARHVRNQIAFHQVVLRLLERQPSGHEANEQPSMERSIAYMENHYQEKITRERLAEIAGVSRSHYSILFKQRTGFSPNEYLSRLRVNRAKELLLNGSGTLREIAQKVGYKDEFYLSRRFKQQTGAPPSGFDPGSIRRVAVWLSPYASHLQLLGLEPAVLVSDSAEYVNADGLRPPEAMKFVGAGRPLEEAKSVMRDNGVDLIIAAGDHLSHLGLNPGRLREVAPVADVSWMEMGWKEHLRQIARLVGRSDRAERWLAEFEREESAARERMRRIAVAGETVTILVVKPDQLLVYGARNVGYVMYYALGLRPPAGIRREMERHGERFHSLPIELSRLGEFAGDRILSIVFPDARGSVAHSESVFHSSYWDELPAVQRHQTHFLEVDDWIPYNPISIRLQLRRAVALFAGDQ